MKRYVFLSDQYPGIELASGYTDEPQSAIAILAKCKLAGLVPQDTRIEWPNRTDKNNEDILEHERPH